jgi:H+/Cl- antiporter ClcA/predicted transcriptional regulator
MTTHTNAHGSAGKPITDRLGDFTADPRVIVISVMAVVVGAVSALVATALVWLINTVTNLAYYGRFTAALASPAGNRLGTAAILVPMIGGLIIGLMARYGSDRIRGHGIPEAMEAILIGRSRMSAKVALLKPISSAISIGTGGPFGAEGPIIMTGGAFGSLFAQGFHLSAAERKTLLVAGAASGMAAIFAAPLASVLLAVELLLFEWKPRSFIPVAAACAMAAALRVPLLGGGPIFPVPLHAALPWRELALSLPVGIAAGFGSGCVTWMVYTCEDLFERVPLDKMWWPVLGGAVVGLGGLIQPRVLGVGYDVIADLLQGRLAGSVPLVLMITKATIWAVALGSGTSGGVLAPLLIMGGSLGAVEAHLLRPSESGLWAMMSMGAMMGGTMRSPLTAVAFMLELTGDLAVLPALLIACAAAHGVTVLFMRRSILTEKVARRGYHVTREYSISPLARMQVEDVMERDVPTLAAETSMATIGQRLAAGDPLLGRRYAWPLVNRDGALTGLVTRGDLAKALLHADPADMTLQQAGSSRLIVTYPDELLEEAVATMAREGIGRLLVVDREHPTRLLGYLGRTGIADAWRELIREEEVREAGWVTKRVRQLRRNVRRVLRGKPGSTASPPR